MGAVTAAVVVAGGTYLASREAKKGAQAQADAAQASLNAFKGVKVPSIEEQQIILQNPDLMGQYTPEQQQAMSLNVSAMQDVKADQGTVDAQNDALKGISEVADGGFTEGDKAASREVQRSVSNDAQARQKAILNSMASRGTLGSGMELAAQLQSAQQASQQMSSAGDNLTNQAQARALQALGQQGSLASSMRGQQFSEGSQKAQAADAINRFNTENQQNIMNSNVNERNRAQGINLAQKQMMENQRAQNANDTQMHNKALIQTQYANRRGQAQDIAGANAQLGAAKAAQANQQAQMYAGIAQGIGTGAMGMYNSNQASANQAKAAQDAYDLKYGKK